MGKNGLRNASLLLLLVSIFGMGVATAASTNSLQLIRASTEDGGSEEESGDESGGGDEGGEGGDDPDPVDPDPVDPDPMPDPVPDPVDPVDPVPLPVDPVDPILPPCDGSAQRCVTPGGTICEVGQGGHECECAVDMSDCPIHPGGGTNVSTPAPSSQNSTVSENYDPPLPNPPPDLDCGEDGVQDNHKVIGEDPHHLDRDGNGIGCEDGEGGGGGGTGGGGGGQDSGSGPINMVPKPGQAVVKIVYEDEWSGSVLDGNFESASYDGSGDSSIAFDCASGDIYSLTIQKGQDNDEVMTLIVEDFSKQVLDQGQTSAEFGIVSLSGTC
jgi:hypothetical protein